MNAPDRSPERCQNLLHPRGRLYMKLSTKAFWIGLPGAMKCQSMALSLHQASIALQVNSVPLFETIEPGLLHRRDESGQLPRHSPAGDRGVSDRSQALLGDVVDEVENTESPSVGELVGHELQRPTRVRPRFHQDRTRMPLAFRGFGAGARRPLPLDF